MSEKAKLTFLAVGDICPLREEAGTIFRHVASTLKSADLIFGNLESPLSDRGTPPPQTSRPLKTSPDVAAALREHKFDVVSFANNHCMDWGLEAFLDTMDHVRAQKVSIIGAGANIAEARKPAIIEKNGLKVAFLAYNSILRDGYWAEVNRPGCVPMRAWTFHEQIESHQPGTGAKTHSFPHRDDLKALVRDVENAKASADLVFVSLHWGIHFVPAEIADYQFDVAHAAIDAGADLIIGHHPHILKGVETYKGKVIFYSLGNFAFDWDTMSAKHYKPGAPLTGHQKNLQRLNPGLFVDPSDPLPKEMRMNGMIKCNIVDNRIESVSFLPMRINRDWEPVPLSAEDRQFADVANYLERITRDQKMATRFKVAGNEIRVIFD